MTTVGVAELRQNLSRYLRLVEQGERLVVTERNRPVAELGPPPSTGEALDRLIAEGRVSTDAPRTARTTVARRRPHRPQQRAERDPWRPLSRSTFYADASALVKLVRQKPETAALGTFLAGADIVSSELALAEVPRAVHRAASDNPALPLDALMAKADDVLQTLALLPVDRALLLAAGALAEPMLRALDAIHIASAVAVLPIDAFVTYDDRQGAAARLAGLRTVAPA